MLKTRSSALVTMVCSIVVALSAVLAGASSASAEECTYVGVVLTCTDGGTSGTPGTDGGSGGSDSTEPPPCDLDSFGPSEYDKNATPTFCMGTDVCFTADLLPPVALPKGDKPNEDSVARGTKCFNGFTSTTVRTFWSDDEKPPSLLEQARTAIDALDFTTPTVGVSPAGRTLVNLDTWFWLDGVQDEVTATAFTVTARATIRSMTVDPGDGSGPFTCQPVATTAAMAEKSCLHKYRRSSSRGSASVGGRAAYPVTVTTVYGLTFTSGGGTITIDGAPETVDGAPATAAVRVDEVQTLSRPNR